MTNETLKKLTCAFSKFNYETKQETYLAEPIEQIYYALYEILGATGYHVLSKESFDELFAIHMEYDSQKNSTTEHILSFVLHLTHIKVTDTTLNQYSLLCSDHRQIYDLLQKYCEFNLDENTIVCKRTNMLDLFLTNNIIAKKC